MTEQQMLEVIEASKTCKCRQWCRNLQEGNVLGHNYMCPYISNELRLITATQRYRASVCRGDKDMTAVWRRRLNNLFR